MTIRRFRFHRYDGLLVGLVLILLLSGFLQNTAKPLNPLSIPLTFYLIVYPLMLLGLWRIIGRSLIRPELLVRFPKRRAFILFYLRNTRLQRWVYSGLVTLSCLLSLTARSLDEGIFQGWRLIPIFILFHLLLTGVLLLFLVLIFALSDINLPLVLLISISAAKFLLDALPGLGLRDHLDTFDGVFFEMGIFHQTSILDGQELIHYLAWTFLSLSLVILVLVFTLNLLTQEKFAKIYDRVLLKNKPPRFVQSSLRFLRAHQRFLLIVLGLQTVQWGLSFVFLKTAVRVPPEILFGDVLFLYSGTPLDFLFYITYHLVPLMLLSDYCREAFRCQGIYVLSRSVSRSAWVAGLQRQRCILMASIFFFQILLLTVLSWITPFEMTRTVFAVLWIHSLNLCVWVIFINHLNLRLRFALTQIGLLWLGFIPLLDAISFYLPKLPGFRLLAYFFPNQWAYLGSYLQKPGASPASQFLLLFTLNASALYVLMKRMRNVSKSMDFL